MLTSQEYYRDVEVVRRILEYCGVPHEQAKDFHITSDCPLRDHEPLREIARQISAEYLSGWGEPLQHGKKRWKSFKNESLGELLDNGIDLFRSVWDRDNLIFLLDLEYVSKRYPGEPYINQEATFHKLEPVYQCIWDIFREFGITPLTLVTGQGYHFVFQVPSFDNETVVNDSGRNGERTTTAEAGQIVELGSLEDTLQGKYEHPVPGKKRDRILEAKLGKAFDGTSKLLEYVVHKTMRKIGKYHSQLPLSIGDVIPGNEMQETINLDLSTYVAPLYIRVMRTAFSTHSKHHDPHKDIGARDIPIQMAIPRHTPCNGNTLSLQEIFQNRRHLRDCANYAASITLNIPTQPVQKLIEEYRQSDLFRFHQDFDATLPEDYTNWPQSYDRFDLSSVPPCVAEVLAHPSPKLLQPTQIQTLVRVLYHHDWWHPKHIAGLIRSKYERDYQWEYNWRSHDAQRHANTWVRFFSGLLAVGLDERTDQNCISHQQKGKCVQPFCGQNIGNFR
jgi:hypothetical protein